MTPLGTQQAAALANRIALHGVDRIFVSTSQRAKDTAAPTAEILKLPVTEFDWANDEIFWSEATAPNERGVWLWYFQQGRYRRLMNSAEVRALGDNWYTHPDFGSTRLPEGISRISR